MHWDCVGVAPMQDGDFFFKAPKWPKLPEWDSQISNDQILLKLCFLVYILLTILNYLISNSSREGHYTIGFLTIHM